MATVEREVPLLPGGDAVEIPVLRCDGGHWRLNGSRCPRCGKSWYPPRHLCPDDLAECETVALSDHGVVHAATLVRRAPVGFDGEFRIAYVDLPEGVRVLARLEWGGDAEPRGGDEVEFEAGQVRAEPPVLGPCFRGPVTRH